jgi:Fic family protein
MEVTDRKYYDRYMALIGNRIPELVSGFDFTARRGDLDFMTTASAVYSSNIEGNSIDLNSYMNYAMNGNKFKEGKEVEEIENLVKAYKLAQNSELTEKMLLKCHMILSETLLIKSKRGKYRTEQVGVFGKSGLSYLAVEPEYVPGEMKRMFDGVGSLLTGDLTVAEVFYFASLIHLKFVQIHPFRDGNGRAARLLEKWFIAQKLGSQYWKLPSEEFYFKHKKRYYETLDLGVNYYELHDDRSIRFLTMLPECMTDAEFDSHTTENLQIKRNPLNT